MGMTDSGTKSGSSSPITSNLINSAKSKYLILSKRVMLHVVLGDLCDRINQLTISGWRVSWDGLETSDRAGRFIHEIFGECLQLNASGIDFETTEFEVFTKVGSNVLRDEIERARKGEKLKLPDLIGPFITEFDPYIENDTFVPSRGPANNVDRMRFPFLDAKQVVKQSIGERRSVALAELVESVFEVVKPWLPSSEEPIASSLTEKLTSKLTKILWDKLERMHPSTVYDANRLEEILWGELKRLYPPTANEAIVDTSASSVSIGDQLIAPTPTSIGKPNHLKPTTRKSRRSRIREDSTKRTVRVMEAWLDDGIDLKEARIKYGGNLSPKTMWKYVPVALMFVDETIGHRWTQQLIKLGREEILGKLGEIKEY